MRTYDMPQYIDSYAQLMWFEIDEVMPFVACFGAGTMLHQMSPMLAIGSAITWFYMKHKRTSLDGSLLHMLFWWGFMSLNKVFRNGLMREWIE
ncbi:type IV conjugative transfer system protein TraL (plasmid) [Burkholderia aenigmatica]|uniref:type IV conjugative transfer system protein TraL n=1 Tax=Burkholderia aenigmatica TaxID=2015348 RepID=UPI003B42D5E3